MANLNKCMIIGNLGQDPEMKYLPNGGAVTEFGVATNRRFTKRDGEQVDETEWFNVVAYGPKAEVVAQHLRKGEPVYVEGRMQTRNWDGECGKKHYKTELILDRFEFLRSRDSGERSTYEPGISVGVDADGDTEPDDLPF